jgi:hypothetical protein
MATYGKSVKEVEAEYLKAISAAHESEKTVDANKGPIGRRKRQ